MSFKDFEQAVNLVEQYKSKCEIFTPQSLDDINNIENILKVRLPKSYIFFLKRYGSLGIGSQEIFGITKSSNLSDKYIYGEILSMTQDERKVNIDPPFPPGFVVIHALGNGELSCLDTSQMNEEGECPVVAWYFGATEKLAEDFGAFLLEKVQWGLESMKEDGKDNN